MLPTITAIGGMTAATALLTTAAGVDQSRTTDQASTNSSTHPPMRAR